MSGDAFPESVVRTTTIIRLIDTLSLCYHGGFSMPLENAVEKIICPAEHYTADSNKTLMHCESCLAELIFKVFG